MMIAMTSSFSVFQGFCRFCGTEGEQREFESFKKLHRVGSDSKPVPPGGRLCCCMQCGAIHKPIDEKWKEDATNVYSTYDLYIQGGGAESNVFPAGDGVGQTRSQRVCELLKKEVQLPTQGRILDVGCGSGLFLKSFGSSYPQWKMVGTEINAQYIPIVEAIPNVEKMYTGSLEEVPGIFDLVTLMHVFEHVVELEEILRTIKSKLNPNGVLLIESPDHTVNPFDLLVADHCNHFTLETVSHVLQSHGYQPFVCSNEWIQKELSVIARPGSNVQVNKIGNIRDEYDRVAKQLDWLNSVIQKADELQSHSPFGTFGSSNAAGWLLNSIKRKPDFLVDEDTARDGRSHLGVKIIAPEKVPDGAVVLIPISPLQAENVQKRLSKAYPRVQWVLP